MFLLSRIGLYIRHLLLAKSRHGTHSPFVYRLLDEVVYAPKPPLPGGTKAERLALALLADRRPESLLLVGEFSQSFMHAVSSGRVTVQRVRDATQALPRDTRFGFVFCQGTYAQKGVTHTALGAVLHGQSALLLAPLYRQADTRRLWRELVAWERTTASVDFYCMGLVFFHGGQAKEHFRIRYN